MSQPWDFIAKLVVIGDSGCGRFSSAHDVTIGVEFGSRVVPVGPAPAPPPSSTSTASTSASTSTTSPSSSQQQQRQKHMKLSLWDTAGQETYKSVTRSYFRGASGALLVFDITRRQTFVHVTDWLNDLRQIAEPDIVVVLVGNKTDLAPAASTEVRAAAAGPVRAADVDPAGGGGGGGKSQRQVTQEEAERWCEANGVMKYVETSAKSGEGVERAFLEVAETIYRNIEAGKYDLNDRRSGVKGPSGVGSSGPNSAARTMNIQLSDVGGGLAGRGGARGWGGGGGCC
ncbi:MAG: hypothetical protein M1816_002528 [Peltula sp. TS41687]|nr:MAG: hypothetical protein M1816_002528 [Peltula sp. TS41687]